MLVQRRQPLRGADVEPLFSVKFSAKAVGFGGGEEERGKFGGRVVG